MFDGGHSLKQGWYSVRTVFLQVIRWHNDRYSTWTFPFHVWKEHQLKIKVVSPRWVSHSIFICHKESLQKNWNLCILHTHSPDLNLIESIVMGNMGIRKDTIKRNITAETFTSFSQRMKILIQTISKRTINCVIGTMEKQIRMVLHAKGNQIKYWIIILFILCDWASYNFQC